MVHVPGWGISGRPAIFCFLFLLFQKLWSPFQSWLVKRKLLVITDCVVADVLGELNSSRFYPRADYFPSVSPSCIYNHPGAWITELPALMCVPAEQLFNWNECFSIWRCENSHPPLLQVSHLLEKDFGRMKCPFFESESSPEIPSLLSWQIHLK